MIRFACPTCQKVLKAPDDSAGRKTHCACCGQRLVIPPPIQVQNKTFLGKPLPESAATLPVPPTSDWLKDVRTAEEKSRIPLPPSAGPITVFCPYRNARLLVDAAQADGEVECLQCGKWFALGGGTLAAPDSPPASSAAASSRPVLESADMLEPKSNTLEQMIGLALIFAGSLMLLLISIAVLPFLDAGTLAGIMCPAFVLFLFLAVVGGIAWELYFKKGKTLACPECKKWWARVHIETRVIAESKCYGLVTRRARSSSSGFALIFGNHDTYSVPSHSSSSTSWKERVPVIRTTYLLSYECKFCRSCWTREKVEEVEDFDIER